MNFMLKMINSVKAFNTILRFYCRKLLEEFYYGLTYLIVAYNKSYGSSDYNLKLAEKPAIYLLLA